MWDASLVMNGSPLRQVPPRYLAMAAVGAIVGASPHRGLSRMRWLTHVVALSAAPVFGNDA
jgi:hypothetical protein